jgi:hypothetical protein
VQSKSYVVGTPLEAVMGVLQFSTAGGSIVDPKGVQPAAVLRRMRDQGFGDLDIAFAGMAFMVGGC